MALPQNETLLRNKDDFNVDMFEVATTTRRPLVAVMVVALEELGSVAKLGLTLQCVLECVADAGVALCTSCWLTRSIWCRCTCRFVSRIGDGYDPMSPYHNSMCVNASCACVCEGLLRVAGGHRGLWVADTRPM